MPIGKSKIEDTTPDHEASIHVWEPRDSSGTGISKITDDSIQFSSNRRRVIVRTKKSGQTNYDIIETSNLTDQPARPQLSVKEKIFENHPTTSTSAVSSSPVVDSEA
ncbi:GSCOCG00000260001-RA-CDS, partial [Cotesia congregata]